MTYGFEGRWQLNILNGDPDAGGNVFRLQGEALFIDDSEVPSGTFEVVSSDLVLTIVMPGIDVDSAWAMRVRLPMTGALGKVHMLGTAEALFDETDPIFIAECAFFRMHDED